MQAIEEETYVGVFAASFIFGYAALEDWTTRERSRAYDVGRSGYRALICASGGWLSHCNVCAKLPA